MKPIFYYLLQMIIASGILYAYYHFALRNKRFHHYNRFYLLAATVISIAIPFLNIPVYFTQAETNSSFVLQTLTAISPVTTEDAVITTTNIEQARKSFSWQNILYLFYALIAAIVLLRIIISLIGIRRMARNNPAEKIDNILFIKTTEPSTPFSFFRWLFWNKKIELHSEKGEQIFKHELFHIQQKHSWDILFLEILSVLFWINPFFYLVKKEVKAIHEFLADRFAINENKKWEYAELLLMQVLNTNHHLVNPFFHNQIKRRIAMITTSKKSGHQYLRKMMVLPVAALVIALFAFTYKQKKYEVNNPQLSLSKTDTTIVDSMTVNLDRAEIYLMKDGIGVKDKKGKVILLEKVAVTIYGKMPKSADSKYLIIINGKEYPGISSVSEAEEIINFGDITAIDIYNGERAIAKYGDKGKNGVIEAFTGKKKPAQHYPDTLVWIKDSYPDTTKPIVKIKVYDKVEIEPAFPGGDKKWREYLDRNLVLPIPAKENAPFGTYTTVIQFIVDKEGNISDLRPLTKHGYGMEDEAVRIIKLGPHWLPAIQNGKQVKAYRKQPITFVVPKKGAGASVQLGTPDPDILFIGIDNYITVSATGVAQKDLRLSISRGTITGENGKYYAKVSDVSDNIILTVADKNGKIHGTKRFKARLQSDIKDPKTTRSLPLEKVRSIQQGKTTSSQIQSLFGEPTSRSIDNDFIYWTYEGNGARLSVQYNRSAEVVSNFRFVTISSSKKENIDYDKAKTIKENQTTFTELEKMFGLPHQVEINNDDESWSYEGSNARLAVLSKDRRSGIINNFHYQN